MGKCLGVKQKLQTLRQKDDSKTNLMGIGCASISWIEQFQNRVHWQTFILVVLNHKVLTLDVSYALSCRSSTTTDTTDFQNPGSLQMYPFFYIYFPVFCTAALTLYSQ
jgi:hypothetical protein